MQISETIEQLNATLQMLPKPNAVVTTMGALHAGHLSLIDAAKQRGQQSGSVIVTIFVNPTQFSPKEDFQSYPRDLAHDLDLLRAAGVNLVFTPTPELMYPQGYQTNIEVAEVAQGLEGMRRPGHFRGVATVVAKLFNLTRADIAFFGQKDAQQVAVIRRLVRDLNFPIEIQILPTVRDADGVALSSRNGYLEAGQRRAATVIYRALQAAADVYAQGERLPKALRLAVQRTLLSEPLVEMEYVSASNAHTLQELHDPSDSPVLLSLAVRAGRTRLIDNMLLPAALNNAVDLTRVLGNPL